MFEDVADLRGAYSISEFVRNFSIGRSTAYKLIAEKKLRCIKVGRRSLITRADADSFLASLPELST